MRTTADYIVARILRIVVTLALMVLIASPTAGQTPDTRGYDSLPDRGQWLLGAARDIEAYSPLTVAQRATYEAIVHALDHHRLLGIVDAVTVIWGEAFQPNGLLSTDGKDQFRLSVVLNRNALTRLWDENFEFSGRGHVKRSSGSSASIYDTDSAREPGGLPKLQVSWLRDDPRIGEIDIDYRSLRSLPHLNPENSDVRGSLRGNPHYCLHRAKYDDSRQKLVDWWNSEPEQCGE